MRLPVYIKTVYFSFLFFSLFTISCLGIVVDIKNVSNESEVLKNEKLNGGTFNSVEYCSFKLYKGDGSFVEAPAYVGDWTGYLIGLVPAIAITIPFRLLGILDDEGDEIGLYTLYGTTKTFGCLFGGPSFIFKGIFWDAPIWLYSSTFGSQRASEASVKPAIEPTKPVIKKIAEDEVPVLGHGWAPVQVKPPEITSISAKPSMLLDMYASAAKSKKDGKLSAVKDGTLKSVLSAVEHETVTVTPVQDEQTSPMTKRLIDNKEPIKDKLTKDDETSWSSPPPLPDWVKEEMK